MGPRRDWSDARQKVEDEGRCRRCYRFDVPLEAAHVIGRRFDRPRVDGSTTSVLFVHPDSIWVACRDCHSKYDRHEIGILAYLTLAEQVRAVQDAGSIESARRRLEPLDYHEEIRQARVRVAAG
jgi:hypothetical protein